MDTSRKISRRVLSGMTLVELMVSIGILVLGMGGLSLLFLRSWKVNGFVLESGIAASSASRAVERSVSMLREARQGDNGDYPIVSGDDFDLYAYVDVDDDSRAERVHLFLEDRDFKMGVTEPGETLPIEYPEEDETVSVLASDIANESFEPVFTFYNDDYPGDTVNNPLSTPVSIGNVGMVRVRLVINIDPNNAPDDTNIESVAEFRNIR